MKRSKPFFLIVTFAAFLCLFSSASSGEVYFDVAEQMYLHGLKALKEGDVEVAIDDFSRILLLKNDNVDARQRLIYLAADERVATMRRIQLQQFVDLQDILKDLRKRIGYLNEKERHIVDQLTMMGVSQTWMESQITVIKPSLSSLTTSLSSNTAQIVDPLTALNDLLMLDKELLQKDFVKMQVRLDDYQALQHKVSASLQDHLKSSPTPFLSDDMLASSQVSNWEVQVISKELALLRERLNTAQQINSISQEKIKNLKNELIEISLTLSEQDGVIHQKVSQIAQLSEELLDKDSRFQFSQAIIDEKDKKIQTLEENLAYFESLPLSSSEKVVLNQLQDAKIKIETFESILDMYKTKLKDSTQAKALSMKRVTDLEDELFITKSEIMEKERNILKVQGVLSRLESELNFVKNQFLQFQSDQERDTAQITNKYENLNDLHFRLIETKNFLLNQSSEFQQLAPLIPYENNY